MKKTHRTAAAAQAARTIDSPVGPLHLAATDQGLTHVLFAGEMDPLPADLPGTGEAARILAETRRQLEEYFAGTRRRFDVPLAPAGTEFQLATWRALQEIPYGETTTYGELARTLKRPRAVRAIGAANGANPIPILIPCHRVIGADGSLVGFGGGLDVKRRLLRTEGISLSAPDRVGRTAPDRGDRAAPRLFGD